MHFSEDELELEKEKVAIQRREIALKEKQNRNFFLSAPHIAIAGSVIALVSGVIGASINSSSSENIAKANAASSLSIERTKVQGTLDLEHAKQQSSEKLARLQFESSLILKAIESSDRVNAIRNLRFFVAAGFISDAEGKIASLSDNELPSNIRPSLDDLDHAYGIAVEIEAKKTNGRSVGCNAVVVSPNQLIAPDYCRGDGSGYTSFTLFRGSEDYELSTVKLVANEQLALLKIEGNPMYLTSMKWDAVRPPVIGETVYMAVSNFRSRIHDLQFCKVLSLKPKQLQFTIDCEAPFGSAGSLIISETDDAPLGVIYSSTIKDSSAVALFGIENDFSISSAE